MSQRCTGLGQYRRRSSSEEANSAEHRNDETHRYTLHVATAPCRRGLRGISRTLATSMSQVDSRYKGCVVIGALRARSCHAAGVLAPLTRSSPRLKCASAAQSQFGNPRRPLSKDGHLCCQLGPICWGLFLAAPASGVMGHKRRGRGLLACGRRAMLAYASWKRLKGNTPDQKKKPRPMLRMSRPEWQPLFTPAPMTRSSQAHDAFGSLLARGLCASRPAALLRREQAFLCCSPGNSKLSENSAMVIRTGRLQEWSIPQCAI
jgi:hypothetical protein